MSASQSVSRKVSRAKSRTLTYLLTDLLTHLGAEGRRAAHHLGEALRPRTHQYHGDGVDGRLDVVVVSVGVHGRLDEARQEEDGQPHLVRGRVRVQEDGQPHRSERPPVVLDGGGDVPAFLAAYANRSSSVVVKGRLATASPSERSVSCRASARRAIPAPTVRPMRKQRPAAAVLPTTHTASAVQNRKRKPARWARVMARDRDRARERPRPRAGGESGRQRTPHAAKAATYAATPHAPALWTCVASSVSTVPACALRAHSTPSTPATAAPIATRRRSVSRAAVPCASPLAWLARGDVADDEAAWLARGEAAPAASKLGPRFPIASVANTRRALLAVFDVHTWTSTGRGVYTAYTAQCVRSKTNWHSGHFGHTAPTSVQMLGLAAVGADPSLHSRRESSRRETRDLLPHSTSATARATRPNLIITLVDDVGYNDVGWRNSDVKTPFLDSLLRNESEPTVELMRHYAFCVCSPTRASLLTGRLPAHVSQVNLGAEFPATDELVGGMDMRMRTLPQLLGEVGYSTAH
eukprot:scaffold52577_cov64-Phaeocystis_antarctica.AAC.2